MTDRHALTQTQVAAAATAALDQAEAELTRLRSHVASLAVSPAAGDVWAAGRSARIVAGIAGGVAEQLRDLAARQSVVS